ncbi:hypothetical protein SAMN05421783_101425 [Thiocapsa roseopersicina]|uniref:Uncharacterized protein n=1 Tax=Thiocapsa roseopersicina TaxID=1058 RepID=A0A1H2QUW5_THIRO|nr:hypothetical protein SAMN05421783_101425 [Thiocapsa roseopersicina]
MCSTPAPGRVGCAALVDPTAGIGDVAGLMSEASSAQSDAARAWCHDEERTCLPPQNLTCTRQLRMVDPSAGTSSVQEARFDASLVCG